MHPIICQFGPFYIYSYGLMFVLSFAVALTLARHQAKKENLNPEAISNFAFLVFVAGIIGARLFYVIENICYYLKKPLEIIMLQHGGLSWFGGLILGVFCGVVYLKKKKIAVYRTLDLVAPFLALGQAIGRIGCLLNGCCYGKVSQFGIYFKAHESILIPTQIYSSLALILIFIILRFVQGKPHKDGQIFYLYLLLYSVKRFFIEFWRADNEIIFLGLTLFQILCTAIFFLSIFKLALLIKYKK